MVTFEGLEEHNSYFKNDSNGSLLAIIVADSFSVNLLIDHVSYPESIH